MYEKSENESPEIQFKRGMKYVTGHLASQDHKQAAYWLKKAASGGHTRAQYMLGKMFETGAGVDKDFSKAYMWFSIAATNGDENAIDKINSYHC